MCDARQQVHQSWLARGGPLVVDPGPEQPAVVGHERLVLMGREGALDGGDQVGVQHAHSQPGAIGSWLECLRGGAVRREAGGVRRLERGRWTGVSW